MSGLIAQSTNLKQLQTLDASRRADYCILNFVFLLAALLHISKGPGILSVIVVCSHVYDSNHLDFMSPTSIIFLLVLFMRVKASFPERFALSMLYPYITPKPIPICVPRSFRRHTSSWGDIFLAITSRRSTSAHSFDVTVIIHCQESMKILRPLRWTAAKLSSSRPDLVSDCPFNWT
jgi:hypothetical protein